MSKPIYTIQNGETIINNYQSAKPFSSFFPGVAGKYGIPLWVFYVNRGQCVSAFGIENKDKAFLEFFPANRAYQLTPLTGFRTFYKLNKSGHITYYEPFKNSIENQQSQCQTLMRFTPSYLILEENNPSLQLKTIVTYMTIPNEFFPGLMRKVQVIYEGNENVSLEMVDGLPWVNSYGMDLWVQKNMSRTGEAWVEVTNRESNMPIYKLKVVIADRPEVEYYNSGNFALYHDDQFNKLPMMIDPQAVFGQNTSLNAPDSFWKNEKFEIPSWQTYENFTPCAMGYYSKELNSSVQDFTIYGVFGHVPELEKAIEIPKIVLKPGWFDEKWDQNQFLIESLENNLSSFSSSEIFDQYSKHTVLDNILRGGMPVTLSKESKEVMHLYSRKHGDLERDYNHFSLQSSYFSQGNGNFRDINQNRRNDLWLNPDVKDANIKTFYNLIQLDGHNPLVLKGAIFYVKDQQGLEEYLKNILSSETEIQKIVEFLKGSYTPGSLFFFLEREKIQINDRDSFLSKVISYSSKIEDTDFGEGYWSDHWTYNQDLIENFLSIFPEQASELLFQNKNFTYYQNAAWINPRKKRYILRNGKPFQTNNIEEDHSKARGRHYLDSLVKTQKGKGEVYHTTLFSKLLCLAVNKIATLDPFGIGIELEGGKTNWNDSVNGLPGLFGSSTNETLELKRLMQFMLVTCQISPEKEVTVPVELFRLIRGINKLLGDALKNLEETAFTYWDQSAALKEKYRESVKLGIKGEEKKLSFNYIKTFLKRGLKKIDYGISKAKDPETGVINSYFWHEVSEYDTSDSGIIPRKFIQKPAALFLEGPMHYLRVAGKDAKEQYNAVKASDLYDKKLKMFKISASLKEMPKEIGRATVFSAGWLENESVFLHMEYKFLLEVLRNGLYDEFFEDFQNALVPFLDPEVYGRSVLENSSFIVTSANSNEKLHGTGFIARLSGSTAEFLSMWLHMNMGPKPFFLQNGELHLQFSPCLPAWLFKKESKTVSWLYNDVSKEMSLPENHYAFTLFGKTLVVYQNRSLKNTYGKDKASIRKMTFKTADGNSEVFEQAIVGKDIAEKVRSGIYQSILVEME